jgi:hypothetical protein
VSEAFTGTLAAVDAAGVKVTFTVQLAPAATVVQLWVCANCELESSTDVTVSGSDPELLTVTCFAAEVVCIDWPPKSRLVGLIPSAAEVTKVAVTFFAASIVSAQLPVPLHAPVQPVKVDPAAGAAASVTAVPELNVAEQVAPQLIAPAGAVEVTVPLPVPALPTCNT